MKYAIVLNKNIECEQICRIVQKMISEYGANNIDAILTLDIVEINRNSVEQIPKLEYKE